MRNTCFHDRVPPSGGDATAGTSILAAASAVALALVSGCHPAPPTTSSFTATPSEKASEARLGRPDAMPPLQPFDEHFVELPDTN